MSLVEQLSLLATRIGAEIKGLVRPEHPGLARAWVNFGYVGGAVQLHAAYNIASVTRLDKGRYRVIFATAMPDANYCWTALVRSNTNSRTQRFAIVRASSDKKSEQFVDLCCASSGGTFADSTEINVVVYR